MKNIKTGTYFYNEENYNFNFATDLSAYRKMMFVNEVVNLIIDENRYDSIIRDLMFDFGLVSILTNIDIAFVNQVDDEGNPINPIIFIEQFLEETNVVDIIKANMVDGLLEQLNKAVDKTIEYKTGIHPSPLNEALANLINTLDKKVNEFDMSGAMEMVQKFAGITGDLNVNNIVDASFRDPFANKHPRFKKIDDITVIKVELK